MSKEKISLLTAISFTALIISLAIVGAVNNYSPVPWWDMWTGYLRFFLTIMDGDYVKWWAQHNEHRILLARILFWIDIKWFHGTSAFLIVVNYLLVTTSALLLYRILRAKTASQSPSTAEKLLGLFIASWIFSWMQSENLTWAFQSQFILAQLLPLCALYWLQKSVVETDVKNNFFIACAFGLASAGTMANGILALPLMVIYAIATRQGKLKIIILTTLSIIMMTVYLYKYKTIGNHGSLIQALRENPLGLLHYLLLYIGSPFYYLFGKGMFGHIVAILAGVILIASSGLIAIKSLRQPKNFALTLALLFFILYIGGTALGTAGGRLIFGVDQALSSRYTTPALMAWATFIILHAETILASINAGYKKYLTLFLILAIAMLGFQVRALKSSDDAVFEREIAALALTLNVKDAPQVNHVYPFVDTAISISEAAATRHLSVFGAYPLLGIKDQLEELTTQVALPLCKGHIDEVEVISDETRFVRVRGWIFEPTTRSTGKLVRFINAQGKIVGFALTGQNRPDLITPIDKKAIHSGYRGYLLANQTGALLTMQGDGNTCQIQVQAPVSLFTLTKSEPLASRATLNNSHLLVGNQWLGSDYAKTVIDNMQVYGSRIDGDANVGSISLKIKRGDLLYYRSGPTGGNQTFEVTGNAALKMILPVSTEWALLEFTSKLFPEGEFEVKISDNGNGWGEWSAIALNKNKE